jgi:hypothetical protein
MQDAARCIKGAPSYRIVRQMKGMTRVHRNPRDSYNRFDLSPIYLDGLSPLLSQPGLA